MASAAQILANQSNARLSTGPKSEAGKQRSASNSFKHGLTSSKIVLPGEDPEEYEALRQAFLDQFQPANSVEHALVEEVSAAYWRRSRALAVETQVLHKLIDGNPDLSAGIAMAFLEKPKEMDRLQRYMADASRAFHRAFNKLEKVQKQRRDAEYNAAVQRAWLAREAELQAQRQAELAARKQAASQSQTSTNPLPQTREKQTRSGRLASFRQSENVPQLSRVQLMKAHRKAAQKTAA